MNSIRLPSFRELKDAEHVLIAGAGGGFDVFSGLPLYFNLHAAGKRVSLANLSFSNLPPDTAGRHLTPELVEVTADSQGFRKISSFAHAESFIRLFQARLGDRIRPAWRLPM